MREDEFYICEEDNIFDELSALYEDLKPCPYADAPSLDLSLDYDGVEEYLDQVSEDLIENINDDGYNINPIDIQSGDIVLASVYQEGRGRNPAHQARPFLITYANAYMVYGFQLTTSDPASLSNYLIEIPNWAEAGLIRPSKLLVNMIRGVSQQYLLRYIGHLTEEQKQVLLNKLYEIKENKDSQYDGCLLNDRIDITIENVERIRC
jgi:hypothetical protein